MRFCLSVVRKALYKKGAKGRVFIHQEWERELDELLPGEPCQYFFHPSTVRWLQPYLRGHMQIKYDDEEKIVFHRQSKKYAVKNHTDFLKVHFEPVFPELEHILNDDTLQDIMSTQDSFRSGGSTARKLLLACFCNPEMLRKMVMTQQRVLEQYDYRACDLRSLLIGFVDRAQSPEDPDDAQDTQLVACGLLAQIRLVLLDLLSKGNDAAALACVLVCAALREDALPILMQFMIHNFDIFTLTDKGERGRIDMGDGFYLTYDERKNYVGGYHKTNVTLWKAPDTMVEKISDDFGYFFYPVEVNEEFAGPKRYGAQIKYACSFEPFQDGKSLITWTYQPDGRYFADDDGFGAGEGEEIILNAWMDQRGKIVTPFTEEADND